MFRFENIQYLYALLLVPFFYILLIFYIRWKKKTLKALSEDKLRELIVPDFSSSKNNWKFNLMIIAFAALVIAWANPQFGTKLEEVKRKGSDIIVALDVSNSMLAQDLMPNRLENAKRSIERLINSLKDDRIGIIVFAGDAFVQLPVTTDYSSARLFLQNISPGMVPVQGTAIGAAIDLCVKSFDKKSTTSKSIIVITDGENHEDDAIQAAKDAQLAGIMIHTIGIGSEAGVPIPLYVNGNVAGYRKDMEGNTVVTKLNSDLLQEIAAAGKGVYVHADQTQSALLLIKDEVDKMQKKEIATKKYTDYEGRFQFFIAFVLLLLFIETLMSQYKNRWFKSLNLFDSKTD